MTKNKIQDLRNHLFETIEMLKDKDMDIDTALAIAKVSQVIIESAKVENQYQRITDRSKKSVFIEGTTNDTQINLIE